jgi:hypothetical protein
MLQMVVPCAKVGSNIISLPRPEKVGSFKPTDPAAARPLDGCVCAAVFNVGSMSLHRQRGNYDQFHRCPVHLHNLIRDCLSSQNHFIYIHNVFITQVLSYI